MGVKEIYDNAFYSCKHLKEIVFEEGSKLKIIGENTFNGCSSLAKIDLPKRLKSIENGTFYKCTSLKSILLPARLEKIGVRSFAQSGLGKIVLPASVKKVERMAFSQCT